LPGQPLYGVDALMERTRLQLASTPEQQAQIALQLAEERANELNQLADNGSPLVAAETIRLQTQTQEALRLAAQLDDPQMLQLLTRLQQMTQTQEQLMAQRSLLDGAAVMAQVRTEAQVGLTDPGAFRAMVQARNMIQAGQDDPAEDEPVDEGDETTLPDDETTDEVTDLPGQNGNNTDPGDPEPGNDTPGIGQQGNSSHGGNEAAGTPGPHGNNVDPGDPAPGNDDAGNGQQGGDGNNGGEQGGGNK